MLMCHKVTHKNLIDSSPIPFKTFLDIKQEICYTGKQILEKGGE